ncbi:MAG: thioether cross-link-forming SCIFF peptide maturase [Bacillota bacterium]|jgi:uncharacterized protein
MTDCAGKIYNLNDIHKFEIEHMKILLDVNSGSVHLIDDIVWDILEAMKNFEGNLGKSLSSLETKYAIDSLHTAQEEITELIEHGMLFSPDPYLGRYVPPAKPVLKSMCFNVAHDCNLRCTYCFASEGDFGGERLLMSEETGKRAIDYLMKNSGRRKHCEIDLFGGEPLMNLDVVKKLVSYGKRQGLKYGKEIKFTITTNAVTLNSDVQDYLNKEDICVVLSIDGRKETNDRVRIFPSGKGSYKIINKNIKEFLERRKNENYYVRGTYTGYNKDFFQDAQHLVEEGYDIISLEPVVAPPDSEYSLTEEDIPFLREQYLELARFYQQRKKEGRPFTFFHFNLDLNNGPCLPKRLTGCGAGHEYLVVTPEGDIYPCHQFVGREKYKLGNLATQEINMDLVREFQNAHVYHKPKCVTCWARFFCSGGCHANADAFSGNIYEPYQLGCELQKMRLECALWLQVMDAVSSIK